MLWFSVSTLVGGEKMGGFSLAIDTTPITGALTDMGAAATPVLVAAIGVAAGGFAIVWLWRKAQSAL